MSERVLTPEQRATEDAMERLASASYEMICSDEERLAEDRAVEEAKEVIRARITALVVAKADAEAWLARLTRRIEAAPWTLADPLQVREYILGALAKNVARRETVTAEDIAALWQTWRDYCDREGINWGTAFPGYASESRRLAEWLNARLAARALAEEEAHDG